MTYAIIRSTSNHVLQDNFLPGSLDPVGFTAWWGHYYAKFN